MRAGLGCGWIGSCLMGCASFEVECCRQPTGAPLLLGGSGACLCCSRLCTSALPAAVAGVHRRALRCARRAAYSALVTSVLHNCSSARRATFRTCVSLAMCICCGVRHLPLLSATHRMRQWQKPATAGCLVAQLQLQAAPRVHICVGCMVAQLNARNHRHLRAPLHLQACDWRSVSAARSLLLAGVAGTTRKRRGGAVPGTITGFRHRMLLIPAVDVWSQKLHWDRHVCGFQCPPRAMHCGPQAADRQCGRCSSCRGGASGGPT